MSNELIIISCCLIGIVAAAWLWRRFRSGRQNSITTPPTIAETDLNEQIQPFPIVDTAAMTKAAANSANTTTNGTWSNRDIFKADWERSIDGDKLPLVEAANIPSTSTSDFMFGTLTPIFAALLPEIQERNQQTRQELWQAGYYQPHAHHNLAAVRYLCIIVPLLLFGTLLVMLPERFEVPLLALLVTVPILGWALPRLYVKGKAIDRKSQIERAIPDLLDMLNMCVSQGLTVVESLDRVSEYLKKIYPALAQELEIISDQSKIGTFDQALQNFSHRIDVPEVHSFTSLLTQTERMGTSITEALEEYSDNMRESLKQRADEKANQATFKILFPTVFCLMPAVYMFLLGPATIELSNFFNKGGSNVLDQNQQAVDEFNTRQPVRPLDVGQ
ncbi:MAG: type II secretion system F family protein [Planctomycetota bacterium]|nr:type II secretion system F family protein [Planctomycetota bacterium]MDA1214982.1 type II secretion system F family protein [Planctomycetota bacterium]